jgi:cytochrome c biogenesis protein CcmG, thiol:disulfide interchange protein DsbE
MRFKDFSALILLLSAVACANKSPSGSQARAAQPDRVVAPDFTEKDIHGVETISLESYRGKVVLLNFWGPWCPPCRLEVPALEKLQDAFKGRVVIIGATVFSAEAPVEQFYKDYKINYPMIWGSYDLMDKYGKVSVFPTTVIIDRHGFIADTVTGARTREQFEAMVKPLLAE